jgi:hypothetical protein
MKAKQSLVRHHGWAAALFGKQHAEARPTPPRTYSMPSRSLKKNEQRKQGNL